MEDLQKSVTKSSADGHEHPPPTSLYGALIPVIFLLAGLSGGVYLFGNESSAGPNQIALLFAAAIAALVGVYNGYSWRDIEKGILQSLGLVLKAVLILLLVGALIGSWTAAGTIPYLVIVGAQILTPEWFYPSVCLICAIVALSIGSSWTTAGTIGVASMGIALTLGLSLPITAGAVISGAYFGDKMSPLSDTTNLAAATAETNLFDHIQHMMWTSVPALILALAGFSLLSLAAEQAGGAGNLTEMAAIILEHFNLSIWSLAPLLLLLGLSLRRIPPLPALSAGILAGLLIAIGLQADAMRINGDGNLISGLWIALFHGYVVTIPHEAAGQLLNRGGMSSMLNTIWLILCAMVFSGVMETTGLLRRLARGILVGVRNAAGLIAGTMVSSVLVNILAADQYMAVVTPGRIYRQSYEDQGLKPVNLSRTLEDSGTLTSVLVPWNTCGAFMAGTLGVATLSYAPFCLFNLLSPLLSLIYAVTGFTIYRYAKGLDGEVSPAYDPDHA